MKNGKFLETNPYTYLQLCNQFEKFKIPVFQRSYNWKNKQINELWESIMTNDEEYFIGNIVCLAANNDSDDRLLIIDGQQRLSTISLFLAVIRDEYNLIKTKKPEDKERKNEFLNEVNELLLYKDKKNYPFVKDLRLLPGRTNLEDIYRKLVNKEFDVDSKAEFLKLDDAQKQYIKNYKIIRSLVRKYIKDEGTNFKNLEILWKKIISLLFIVIVCASDNDAYKIFEGLNATGLGLSVADLVKNSVMQSVRGREGKQKVEDIWDDLESVFTETKTSLFPKFLRHSWISSSGYISTSKLFNAIKVNKLKNKDNSEIIKFTNVLLEDAKAYIAFKYPGYENYVKGLKKGTLEILERFRYLDVDQVYELILAYYKKYISNKNYTEKQFNSDLNKLWIFSLRAKIISLNPSEYEKIFADHCLFINNFNKKEMNLMSSKFYNELSKKVSNDSIFTENFATDLEYGYENNLIRYLLKEIILKETPGITFSDPTIEHIIPQDFKSWGINKDLIEEYIHNIGNLTILDRQENGSNSNKSIDFKVKNSYSKSYFQLIKNLAKKTKEFKVNPVLAIKKNASEYAKIANNIWKF